MIFEWRKIAKNLNIRKQSYKAKVDSTIRLGTDKFMYEVSYQDSLDSMRIMMRSRYSSKRENF
jgi:hypothetical protein